MKDVTPDLTSIERLAAELEKGVCPPGYLHAQQAVKELIDQIVATDWKNVQERYSAQILVSRLERLSKRFHTVPG